MTRVYVKTVGGRSKAVDAPLQCSVEELAQLAASVTGFPLNGIKLIYRGNIISKETGTLTLKDGESIIAMVAPKAPPPHVSSRDGEIEDEDEDLRFQIPDGATPLERMTAQFLKNRLHFPDPVLVVFFWLRLRTWALILLWAFLAPVAQQWELGPIFIIFSIFVLMWLNLGKRQAGEASAYSIFNEGFRELPGTLNADRLDQDIRAGQF